MQQNLTMGRTQMVFAALSSGIAFFSLDAKRTKRTRGPAARFDKVIHADLARPIVRVDQAQITLLPGTVGSSVTITDDALQLDADSGQTGQAIEKVCVQT
jgi:hypothetical protein